MGVHVPIKISRHVVDFSTFFILFRSKCMIFQFCSNHRTPQHHKSAHPSFISKLSDCDRNRCRFQLLLVHIFLSPRGGPRPYPPIFSYALFKNHTNVTRFFQISLQMRTNFIKFHGISQSFTEFSTFQFLSINSENQTYPNRI